jgi:hypothetical protein
VIPPIAVQNRKGRPGHHHDIGDANFLMAALRRVLASPYEQHDLPVTK